MQHFQHKERASKQLFMGTEPLSHLQLPLWGEKELSILTVPKYRGSSGDGEDRWPFPASQTAITAAAAFHFGKQPFGKLGTRVWAVPCHLWERTHVLHTPSPKTVSAPGRCLQRRQPRRRPSPFCPGHSRVKIWRAELTPCLRVMNAEGFKQELGEMQTRHQICSLASFPISGVSHKCRPRMDTYLTVPCPIPSNCT